MNRRDFMRRMFGLTVTIAVPSLVTDPLSLFFDMEKINALNPNLYGMDWGVNDGTYGTWMGLKRSNDVMWVAKEPVYGGMIRQDLVVMIKKLMDNALDKHWEIIIANDEQMKAYKKLI